jgi:hypothetical protein
MPPKAGKRSVVKGARGKASEEMKVRDIEYFNTKNGNSSSRGGGQDTSQNYTQFKTDRSSKADFKYQVTIGEQPDYEGHAESSDCHQPHTHRSYMPNREVGSTSDRNKSYFDESPVILENLEYLADLRVLQANHSTKGVPQ